MTHDTVKVPDVFWLSPPRPGKHLGAWMCVLAAVVPCTVTACGGASPGALQNPDGAADASPVAVTDAGRDAGAPDAAAVSGQLTVRNSAGRTGSYFLPPGYAADPRPMLVAYHGTGGSGADMVTAFQPLATARRFIIVAPDSRVSPDGQFTWEVGIQAGQVTEDVTHTLDCIAEVQRMAGVATDASHLLAAGFSGGGSSAPYFATNQPRFTAFAVLHGGVVPGGIGTHIVPGWFSTGDADTVRPAAGVPQSEATMQSLGFTQLEFHTFPGGHALTPAELGGVVDWWLSH